MMRVVVGKGVMVETRNTREYLDPAQMAPGELFSMATTDSLFGGERSFVIEGVLADPDLGDDIIDHSAVFTDSPHEFVFLEEKLLKKPSDKLTKAGVVPEVHASEKKAEAFNVFAIADAMAAKDRKRLWLLLTKALQNGIAPENIAGILAWKARDMLAKRQGNPQELKKLSRAIVGMYHDSHRGAGDLGLLLERFALRL